MDLGIGIKVDPGDAVSKAKAVEDQLGKTEDRSKQLQATLGAVAGAFKSLSRAVAEHQAALERTNGVHARLTSGTTAAAGAFGKMAEAMRKEQEILERIHGPARRYAEDLQALDALLARNVISTQQYADQVRRLNHEIDGTPKVPATAAAGPTNAGLLKGARGAMAAVGITVGASQLAGLADEYTNIQNRLRQMTPDQEHANKLFEQLHGIANRTRSDLSATVDAFAGMSRATKALGLSQAETLRVTETLNKLVTLSGKSATESAAGLMQFSQALSSGRLQGDELRSVFENMPTLVDALTKSLGVSQAELRKMGSEGLITSRVMVTALQQAASSVDASMGKSIPTLSQSWTTFKNDMMATFGSLNQSLGITDALGSAMKLLGTAIQVLLTPLKLLGAAFDAIGISGGTVVKVLGAAGIATAVLGGPAGIIAGLAVGIGSAVDAIGDWVSGMNNARLVQEQFVVAQQKAKDAVTEGAEAVKMAHREMVELSLRTTLGTGAVEAFANAWNRLDTIARKESFKKLFEGGWKGQDGPGFVMGDSIGGFQSLYGKGDDNPFSYRDFDESGAHASTRIAAREKEIELAKKELAALERQFASYDHGKLSTALYKQEKQKLQDVINGTSAATRKETESIWAQIEAMHAADRAADEWARKHRDRDRSVTGGVIELPPEVQQAIAMAQARARSGAINDNQRDEHAEARRKRQQDKDKAEADLLAESKKRARETQEAWATGLGSIGRSFLDMARDGKSSFSDMVGSMLKDLTLLIAKMAALKMVQAGGGVGLFGTFFTSLLGGANGFDYAANSNRLQLPGFATGGSFTVDGVGGTDSRVAAFRVTPGESVHVRTPQQTMAETAHLRELRMAAQEGARGDTQVLVNVLPESDPGSTAAAMGTFAGKQVLVKHEQQFRRRRTG